MRVITGKYKGRHFDVPRSFKARPTTDFAKENLFNVLRAYVDFSDCTALDLFAGTGSISLELLSRGCRSVVSVEKDRRHYLHLRSLIHQLGDEAAHMVQADVLRFLPRCREKYDIIFADPPYVLKEIPLLPSMIFDGDLLTEEGVFVLEHGRDHDFSVHPCFREHREYGSVNFSFFTKGNDQ